MYRLGCVPPADLIYLYIVVCTCDYIKLRQELSRCWPYNQMLVKGHHAGPRVILVLFYICEQLVGCHSGGG